ncbi:MAG: hypothetical protein NZ561_13305 [Phycisphaerae bacterium]|nr:hypothetical protein [Phycisphaerae bacterium]MDW8262013.1 hypothetical protein [Phycisphaerales bacterium]
MQQRIVINGREFGSPDEMPPDIRAIYDRLMVDRDGNGVPDVIDEARAQGNSDSVLITRKEIVIDGKTYHSLEEVPAELRPAIEKAFADSASTIGDRTLRGASGWIGGRSGPSPRRPATPGMLEPEQPSRFPILLVGVALGAGLMLLVLWLASRS